MYSKVFKETILELVERKVILVFNEDSPHELVLKNSGQVAHAIASIHANCEQEVRMHGENSISQVLKPLAEAYGNNQISPTERLMTNRLLSALEELSYTDIKGEMEVQFLRNQFHCMDATRHIKEAESRDVEQAIWRWIDYLGISLFSSLLSLTLVIVAIALGKPLLRGLLPETQTASKSAHYEQVFATLDDLKNTKSGFAYLTDNSGNKELICEYKGKVNPEAPWQFIACLDPKSQEIAPVYLEGTITTSPVQLL